MPSEQRRRMKDRTKERGREVHGARMAAAHRRLEAEERCTIIASMTCFKTKDTQSLTKKNPFYVRNGSNTGVQAVSLPEEIAEQAASYYL